MIDNIILAGTLLISLVSLFYSIKKQGHDTAKTDADTTNVDVDTITALYSLVNEQETRYKNYKLEQEEFYSQLKKEFELYKNETSTQIADVVHENKKLRSWARRLCKQLESAGIVPEQYEV